MKTNTLWTASLLAAGAFAANAATIIENGKTDYAILTDTNAVNLVAADELREIILKSTGVELPVVCTTHSNKQAQLEKADHFLFVGRTPEAETAFGADTLGANDYAVTEKKAFFGLFGGGDVWLRGNNWNGTLLAVYAFCEDVLGFRHFTPEEGGEKIVKTDRVDTKGYSMRRTEAFPLRRGLTHTYLYDSTNLCAYLFRNGSTGRKSWAAKTKYKDLESPIEGRDSGHGFCLYMPCKRLYMDTYPWDERIDFFATHPEWFSMNSAGKRTDRMQLCFASKEMRAAFTKRVLERCRRVGGKGILTIGANDVPGALCWCPECVKLQKKYETPFGPYWDYLPQLCAAVAKEYPEIYIETLAYRKEQSENFPKGVEKLPDNFIVDFAPVDDDQYAYIGGPRNEKTYENLKKWCRACKYVDYWFYSCMKHPCGPVSRVAGDLRRMHEAGTDGAKLCGIYTPSLTCLQDYLFLRLALDPSRDEWAVVKEFCDFIFGNASETAQTIVLDWDKLWFEKQSFMSIDADMTTRKCYRAADIIRWQAMLDAAEKKLGADPNVRRAFGIFRWDVDLMTLSFWDDVRKLRGLSASIHPDTIYERMKRVTHWKRYGAAPKPGKPLSGLYATAENAYLVSKALDKPIPAPLDKLGPEVVIHQIPQCGGFFGIDDPDAACGRAKSEVYKPGSAIFTNNLVGFDYYNHNLKRNMKAGKIDISGYKPGEYKLYKVGDFTIPVGAGIELASWWGIGQSLSNYYPEGDADRVFELWVSLKFIGPDFGLKTGDGKNRMVCDRFFLVDKNGKKYKGETK